MKKPVSCLLALCSGVLAVVSSEAHQPVDQDIRVVRIQYADNETLAKLREIEGFQGLDWRRGYAIFELGPARMERLSNAGWNVEVDPERQAALERWLDLEHRSLLHGDPGTIPGFACYRTVDQTDIDMQALAAAFPDQVDIQTIGETWQQQQGNPDGDDVQVLIIGNQTSPHPQAPLVIMAAQHARELTTAEIAARFAEHLLQKQATDPDIRWLFDHRKIHVITHLNRDGRREVETGTAFWRKNVNTTACPTGNLNDTWPGIDLNRNSGFLWGNPNSSGNTCSQVYRGPVASSEPETQAIQNYLESVFQRQRPATDLTTPSPDDTEGLFISIHSFSELVLLPWDGLGGGNENNAPNHEQLTILGRKFGFFTDYAVGRWQLLGPAGGTTTDYAYGEYGVASYTFEVGTTFQQPCDSFENTIWPVNLQALVYAARAARRPYQTPFGPEVLDLGAWFDGSRIQLSGQAADDRFFRGNVSEPPTQDPVFDIVEVVVSLGVPPYLAAQTFSLPVAEPSSRIVFSGSLPPDISLPSNNLVFAVAVDVDGAIGVPVATMVDSGIFSDGFESGS